MLILINSKMHFETRRGSQAEAIEYCKKDGDYYENGSKRIQRERTDLLKIKNQIKEGTGMREIIDSYDIQSHNQIRVIETYVTYLAPKEREKPTVYWAYGAT